MSRGIIFTSVVFLLLLALLNISMYHGTHPRYIDTSYQKTSDAFDSINQGYSQITGLKVEMVNSESSHQINFIEDLSKEDISSNLHDFETAIEEDFFERTLTNISISGISSTDFTIVPKDLSYSWEGLSKDRIMVYNLSGGNTSIESIHLRFEIDGYFVNSSADIGAGSSNFEIMSVCSNQNDSIEVLVNPQKNSSFEINLEGASYRIRYGENQIGSQIYPQSLVISRTGSVAGTLRTSLLFDGGLEVGVRSNARIRINDKLDRSDNIWLTQPVNNHQQ